MKISSGLAAALLASTIATAPAAAVVAVVVPGSNYSFNFVGVCTDCRGTATATLNVVNYVLGQSLTAGNFGSFVYTGTDLVKPFTLSSVASFSGALNVTPGPYSVSFSDGKSVGATSFSSSSAGNWLLSVPDSLKYNPTPALLLVADYGPTSSYTTSLSSAPEPATWAMLVGGFGLVGTAMRRKTRTRARFA